MSKVNLNSITNLSGNPGSAETNINANFAALQAQIDLLLSRDGEAPNPMLADLDMNSHNLINVGAITQTTELPFSSTIIGGTELPTFSSDSIPPTIIGLGDIGTFQGGATFHTIQQNYGMILFNFGSSGADFPAPSSTLRSGLMGWRTFQTNSTIGAYDGANENGVDAASSFGLFRKSSGKPTDQSIAFVFFRSRIPSTNYNTNGRHYIGLWPNPNAGELQASSGALTNAVNCIVLGKTDSDTNLYIYHNDNAGAATKLDTGFVIANIVNHLLEFYIILHRETGNVDIKVIDRETNIEFTRTLTTNLPVIDQELYPRARAGVGYTTATSNTVALNNIHVAVVY